jgi:broad specificity phosphatase PhoE
MIGPMSAGRPSLLVVVRHAESERTVAKKGNAFFLDDESRKAVQGVADHHVSLTDEGRRQAEVTGRALRAHIGRFDCVYHSGYRRTEETTAGLLSAYSSHERASMPVCHHLFLRERDAGWAYDMTTAEAEAAFPWLRGYWETFGRFFARPPGGESMADVVARVDRFLNELFRDHAGRRALLVTHGGTLRALRYLLEGWTYEEFTKHWCEPVPNCAVTAYEWDSTSNRLTPQTVNAVYWR